MKVFITGINGFIGYWLSCHLLKQNDTVVGLARKESQKKNAKIKYYYGNILDFKLVKTIIQKEKPEQIFHLASQSNISYSFSHPQETINVNINGTLNLLESIYQTGINTTFLSVGSSAEYGCGRLYYCSLPEDAPLYPSSPYGVSKASQGLFTTQVYRKIFGLDAIHIRPFAVIGPGKKNDAISDFARGIVAIEQGKKKYLPVGDIHRVRDFIDVRDVVNALLLIAKNKSQYDTYNLCCGEGTTLQKILDIFARLTSSKIKVKQTPQKKRHVDDAILVGSPKRLQSLGFRQRYLIETSLQDVLDYWRKNNE